MPSHSRIALILHRFGGLTLLLGAFVLLSPAGLHGQALEEAVEEPSDRIVLGVESELASRYLWRGMTCSEGAVSQTSVWAARSGFTGSAWMNYDLEAAGGAPSFNEVDLALSASTSVGSWDIESTIQTYSYPRQPDYPWTAEVSVAVTWNIPIVQPYSAHTVDVKEYSGAYFGEVGLISGWAIRENLELDARASAGWGSAMFNEAYLGTSVSALQVVSLDAGLTWSPAGALYVRPHLVLAAVLDSAIRSQVEDESPVQVGLVVGGEF